MTIEEAREIVELAERARLRITQPGEIPADWVALRYLVSRGEAVSLIREAQDTIAHGAICPTCQGRGRVK